MKRLLVSSLGGSLLVSFLVACLVSSSSSFAAATLDPSAIVGVWRGKIDALPAITLTVEQRNGKLTGAVLFYLLRRDDYGPETATPGVPEPLIDPTFDGKTLRFRVSHSHAHPGSGHDQPVALAFVLTDAHELKGVNPGAPEVAMVRDPQQ